MTYSSRKVPKFTVPTGARLITVEDEPERDIPAESYEPKSQAGIVKIESECEKDVNDITMPYVDLTLDAHAGAEKEMLPQPTISINTGGLGNSILQPPKAKLDTILQPTKAKLGTIQTDAQKKDNNVAQATFYAKFAFSGMFENDRQDDFESEPEPGIEDPIVYEFNFQEDRKAHARKQQAGTLTEEEALEFSKKEIAYEERKREFNVLSAQLDEEEGKESLFVPEKSSRKRRCTTLELASESENSTVNSGRSGTKKRKTTKPKSQSRKGPRKSCITQPPAPLNLGGHNDFWENINAVDQMNTEPTVEGGAGGRTAALKNLRNKVNAPLGAKKAAALDLKRLKSAMQSFVSKHGKAKGNKSVVPVNGGWLVRGMSTSLKSHQIINCGWMRSHETGVSEPKGGIIADQMGLGKTLTCLANIVNGRPLKSFPHHLQRHSNTTLIVVPSNLLGQWRKEIKKHTKKETKRELWGLGKVYTFRDSMSKDCDPEDFEDFDIVLTTYHDVWKSWPHCEYPEGLSEQQRHDFWLENFYQKRGPLHRYPFLRVVLDEGHKIANPEAQVSQACFNLVADHKWILTGTPMINGSMDLYSLFYFIGHPAVKNMTFDSFKSRYCNGKNPMSLDALSQEMVECFACFTLKDMLFGARLVTLPKARHRPLILKPTKLEIALYNVVRMCFKTRAQTLAANGNVRTASVHVFAMYTLLRQMTAHPLIVPSKVCDYLELDDFDKLEKAVDEQVATEKMPISTIHALKFIMKQRRTRSEVRAANGIEPGSRESSQIIDEFDEGIDEVDELRQPDFIRDNDNERGTGGSHGKNVEYSAYVESFRRTANFHIFKERSECCSCKRLAENPVMTSCHHLYCHTHLNDLMHLAAEKRNVNYATCVKEGCGKQIKKNTDLDPESVLKPRWLDTEGSVLPSTKTIAIKAQVLSWFEFDPSCKIIIFCLWKPFLDMIARICEIEGWGYTTLHGRLRPKVREANIERFKSDPDVKILIATLKTGGVGLNLTCARYVLNVDPYWNNAAEAQAFSRVFRIGQDKETEFVNLTLEGTVDEHLNAIKQRKKLEIDQVNAGHKRLNMAELLKTFDSTEEDPSDDSG